MFLFAFGCGDGRPARVPVSGRVLIDGKPLTVGAIQVVPRGNRASGGKLDENGRFTLTCFEQNDGCVLGKHPVAVNASKHISSTTRRWFAPKKYANYEHSGLEIEVNGPTDDLEIHLVWEGSGHDGPFDESVMGE
ncbi:MAG: hypothetical protein JXB10_06950 [Pirellulales bacterium]|nr:hypothetical protein [Pirellulales bacterium]